ncbi:MAG: M36 family metallopeptidase, partial [Actinobacteria bacterium]|nr:M36 family metallopeptidase [Actinomycetota bacterium]
MGALVAAMSVLVPASAFGNAALHEHQDALSDLDVRAGSVAPTAAQRDAAEALGGVTLRWNRFGTPQSLVRHGGYLARNVQGANAVAAGRAWLAANKALFGLDSTAGLELHADSPLAGGAGHAVHFRQTFGGLRAAPEGLVTVAMKRVANGWDVTYVSSSIARESGLVGSPQLSPEQAWIKAADAVGVHKSIVNIKESGKAAGWDTMKVAGLPHAQRAKLVAFPTLRSGVIPAYEAIVLSDTGDLHASKTLIDARNGTVLARQDLEDNLVEVDQQAKATAADAPQVQVIPFAGTLPPNDGGCGPLHGPYTVGAGVRALDVFANAVHPLQDIVLRLYKGAVLLAEADTFFTPERIYYAPSGGVPPGNDYFVQVCEYADGGPPVEPRDYTGTFTIDDTAAPAPYTARWKVFPRSAPINVLPMDPWNNPSTDTRQTFCWAAAASGCDFVVGNLASRGPWDHDFRLNAPTNTTIGNNAKTAESWTHDFLPSPFQHRPVSAVRDYSYPWTNDWFNRDANPNNFVPNVGYDVSASVVNLFVAHNRMHDWAYFLGFTERNWNAQDINFGETEVRQEGDPIVGDAQAGGISGARDNANMITLPDGLPSITNMYFWQPFRASFYPPSVDGDYDMSVIGHEYAHMIENRMIGKGSNRSGHHAG